MDNAYPPRHRWYQLIVVPTVLVLAAFPLPLYPFVLLADIMGVAAERGPGNFSEAFALYYVVWGTLLYPIFYAYCAIQSIWWWRKPFRSTAVATAPFLYLSGLLAVLGPHWTNA